METETNYSESNRKYIRAKKHVEALQKCVDEGNRAVLLFCVQHNGIIRTGIASEIDPAYGEAVRLASRAGVEVLAYAADIQVEGVKFLRQLEFEV